MNNNSIPNLKLLTEYLSQQKGLQNGFNILANCILSDDPELFAKDCLNLLTGKTMPIDEEL